MREIYAHENQDGTYSVSITNTATKRKYADQAEVTETVSTHMEIQRAAIQITASKSDHKDGDLFKLEVEGNE